MSEERQTGNNVVDRSGIRGTLDLAAMPPDGKQSRFVLVRFHEDSQVFISADALVEMKGGDYFYPESFDEALLAQDNRTTAQTSMATSAPATNNLNVTTGEHLVVPMVAEELRVEKRLIERGVVRITKTVSERAETVDLPLMEEQTEIERVAINRPVEVAPPVRYEGDVMIVPLLEEVIVTEKRLMLREELHIRKRRVETRKPQRFILRREEANIERFRHDDASQSPESGRD